MRIKLMLARNSGPIDALALQREEKEKKEVSAIITCSVCVN